MVEKLASNLFSVRAAAVRGKSCNNKCFIYNRAGIVCGTGTLVGKLYQLDCEPISSECVTVASEKVHEIDLWHQRLGKQSLRDTISKRLVDGVSVSKATELSFCEGCVEGKIYRKPFKPVGTAKLQLVHSDVCDPMTTESIGGKKYFVTFIDDYSRCCSVYFMKHKSAVLEKFKEFETATTTDSRNRIRRLRTDSGGEYVSRSLKLT